MIGLRKTLATIALLALGGLILTLERGSYGVNPGLVVATRALLLPLAATIIGLLLDRYWGRWLALAGAVAVLPWALVLTFGLPPGAPLTQQAIALAAALLLLITLLGRKMFERYEGRAAIDWSGLRMGLVRWTIILNIAAAVGLFVFLSVYRYRIEWHSVLPALLLAGLVVGVWLLAQQKTGGLLLVALSCVLFVPVAVLFVWKESSYAGGVRIFALSFLPGIAAGWACLFAFGRPVWRALRSE